MDKIRYFGPSPNASGTNSEPTLRHSQSFAVPDNCFAPTSSASITPVHSRPQAGNKQLLPGNPIRNVQIHDLVILVSSVEPRAAGGVDKVHHAGHINDIVCRYPSTIIGRGATFVAKKVLVPCGSSCEQSRKPSFVVTKTLRVTSKTEQAGDGIQRRLRNVIFELRVLNHEPIMFHANIVRLLGISWEDDPFDSNVKWPSLVQEYANAGTIESALADGTLPKEKTLKICLDVAKGLTILHECGIIHSDIKAQNVLLFSDERSGLVAKIADFGFSIVEHGAGARLDGATRPWNAPEWRDWIPAGSLAKTDVYSFGLLVWAITTRPVDPVCEIMAEYESTAATLEFNNTSLGIDGIKSSPDDRMLAAISSHTRMTLGTTDDRLSPVLGVLERTVRQNPKNRDLAQAASVLAEATSHDEQKECGLDEGQLDLGDMCRTVWDFCKTNSPNILQNPRGIMTMCSMLTAEAGISNGELGELQRECGGRIDELFFEKFCKLATTKSKAKGTPGLRRVDEIRVLTQHALPDKATRLNPDIVAFETSRFSANHVRLLHPDVQKMMHQSLIRAANEGSPDAALFLAIFHVNVGFDPEKAANYMLQAARLGSSSGKYMCYRLHKALGKDCPTDKHELAHWLFTGACWGSQIALHDDLELNGHSEAILFLRVQGSCNGDTPFREAQMKGPFDLIRDSVDEVRAKIKDAGDAVDDITLPGDNGDKLLHWAAAIFSNPIDSTGILKHLVNDLGADLNVRSATGDTPLIVAARASNAAAVLELLRRGADVALKSNSGQVALHWLWAIPEFRRRKHDVRVDEEVESLRVMAIGLSGGSRDVLDAVANPVTSRVNGYKDVDHAARLQTHILSDLPAGTPLHWAIQRRAIACVKGLLAAGANPLATAYGADTEGGPGHGYSLNSLHLAAAMHDDDILSILLDNTGPRAIELCRPGLLAVAIDGNSCQGYPNGRFERMIRHGPAYEERARRTFQLLWDNGCRNLGYGFDNGDTSLGNAGKQATPLLFAVQSGQADIVDALMSTPFSRDFEVRAGEALLMPIHESIRRRSKDVYFLLKRRGADVHARSGQGFTTLAIAANFGQHDLDVVQNLIESGVPIRSTDPADLPPFAAAVANGFFDIARLLLDHGASPNDLFDSNVGLFEFRNLSHPMTILGWLLSQFDRSKFLSLTWLLRQHIDNILPEPLLVRVCPSVGWNVFHVLAMTGEEGRDDDAVVSAFQELVKAFPGVEPVNQLMDPEDSKFAASGIGQGVLPSPLLLAATANNIALVDRLVRAGANPLLPCGKGHGPLAMARQWVRDYEADVSRTAKGLEVRRKIVSILEEGAKSHGNDTEGSSVR